MSRNIQSDGTAEDIIRAFVQVGCAELHMKTLVEKYNAQLENGLIDIMDNEAVGKQIEKITSATDEVNDLAETRRSLMLILKDMYDGDPDYWCVVKHTGLAMYCAFEAYQASEDDQDLYTAYLETNKRFIKALTHFLGTEISDCAACFGDILKAKGKEDHDETTGNKGTV